MFLPMHNRKKIKFKSYPVINFSLDETIKYFADLKLSKNIIKEIYYLCGKGIPGNLYSVRRNIQAGYDPNQLIKKELLDLYELEWQQVENNPKLLTILALIVYTQHPLCLSDIARILKLNKQEFKLQLKTVTFINIEEKTEEINFISKSFTQFVNKKLNRERINIINLIIEDLISRPDSEATINNLPTYYLESNKFRNVLEILKPEYFRKILSIKQTLIPIYQQIDIGIKATIKLKNNGGLLRFGI